ncbi:MAG TPA: PilZ domain-containing protein [Vicinamibacterales bacterium]
MPTNLAIVVADATRLKIIRERLRLPGQAMHFSATNLVSAIDHIRSYQPNLIAVDALYAQTPAGIAAMERIERAATSGAEIRLITALNGQWVTVARKPTASIIDGSAASVITVSRPALPAAPVIPVNTRRAPRFLLRDTLSAIVENGSARLVDISALGAQVVSQPALRPNQTIKLALPDTNETLRVTAHVAWSMFEKPQTVIEPYYRAGIQFTNYAQQALEDYRRRHCADQPIPNPR